MTTDAQLHIELGSWDEKRRCWELQPALAINATHARVWLDGRELAASSFALSGGLIWLRTDEVVTKESSVKADLVLRRSSMISTQGQAVLVALIGILPALLTFLAGQISTVQTAKPQMSTGTYTVLNPKIEVAKIVGKAHHVTIVCNWVPEWLRYGVVQPILESGGTVNLFLPNIGSVHLAQRSIDLGKPVEWGKESLLNGLNDYHELYKFVGASIVDNHLMIKTHSELAPFLIIKCDGKVYLGPFLHNKKVGDAFMIHVEDVDVLKFVEEELLFIDSKSTRYDLKANRWSIYRKPKAKSATVTGPEEVRQRPKPSP